MTKILTFYLPQYHSFPENDKWWGKGFTDWVNVKNARQLFWGHQQPRVPYQKNYYDLSDENVMCEQMKIAQEYGVYGFCFYHYWFDGKKLMEKPLEALLNNKKGNLPYCFCWANEPWMRTWDGVTNNKEMLMPQHYGADKEWREHFEYLLDFFKDDRYIKIEGKPVFVIYRPTEIPNCHKMQELWNNLACENGFSGIYFIKMKTAFQEKKIFSLFSATVDFEPMRTMKGHEYKFYQTFGQKFRNYIRKKDKLDIISYEKVCQDMINKPIEGKQTKFLGMFAGWDNSPRRGKNGLIMKKCSPEIFEKYLTIQMERSKELHNEYLFVNAWNEWAEGAYLEADEKNGYAYLEAVKRIVDKEKEKI